MQAPKPSPPSFAREAFFGVTPFQFSNREGVAKYGAYRITTVAGIEHLNDTAASGKDAYYLFGELRERIARQAVEFDIHIQAAESGDVVDDDQILAREPQTRSLWPDRAQQGSSRQRGTAEADHFRPVDGIEASADPLLELRDAVYLLSGRRRRQAPAARTA